MARLDIMELQPGLELACRHPRRIPVCRHSRRPQKLVVAAYRPSTLLFACRPDKHQRHQRRCAASASLLRAGRCTNVPHRQRRSLRFRLLARRQCLCCCYVPLPDETESGKLEAEKHCVSGYYVRVGSNSVLQPLLLGQALPRRRSLRCPAWPRSRRAGLLRHLQDKVVDFIKVCGVKHTAFPLLAAG